MLIVEIKDDSWVDTPDRRFKVDAILPHCALPRLWGLSLLGTSLRVYCGDSVTSDVKPVVGDRRSHVLPHNFLEGAWNIDILSQEGFTKMKEVIRDSISSTAAFDQA